MKIEKVEDFCTLIEKIWQTGYEISFESNPSHNDPPSFFDYHIHRFWEVKILLPDSTSEKYKIIVVAPGTVHCMTHWEVAMDISPHAITLFGMDPEHRWQMFFDETGSGCTNLIPELLHTITRYAKGKEFDFLRNQLMDTALKNLCLLIRQHISVPKIARHGKNIVKKALDYMENSYYNPDLSITEIAAFIGISTQYLNLTMQKETGRSTRQNLIHIRLKHACELLENREYLIKDVAILTGWKSAYYFSNAFRAAFGISPKKYTLDPK